MGKNTVRQCKGGENCHEENHLCKIAARKVIDRIRKIVKGAEYFCRKCGRAASLEKHLCKPSAIGG